MLNWLTQNAGTIFVLAILAAIVAVIIIGMVRSKKKGKSSCGCGCANCAMADACHQNKQKKQS